MILTKGRIQAEAFRIFWEMANLAEPNSPSGTHYMSILSDEFVNNCHMNDHEMLLRNLEKLGLSDIALSTTKSMRGLFAFTRTKIEAPTYQNGTFAVKLIKYGHDYSILTRLTGPRDPSPFIVAFKITRSGNNITWAQGHYFSTIEYAVEKYLDKIGIAIE